jgi:hypothetical protein
MEGEIGDEEALDVRPAVGRHQERPGIRIGGSTLGENEVQEFWAQELNRRNRIDKSRQTTIGILSMSRRTDISQ